MLRIYAIVFSVLHLTVEVRNEENTTQFVKDLKYKRDSFSSFARDALPSRENGEATDAIIYGFVGAKKPVSSSTKSTKQKGRKRYSRYRGEREDDPSSEEMMKDVADLREDIEAIKSVMKTEEDKIEELEEAVERRGGGNYWPYSYSYY